LRSINEFRSGWGRDFASLDQSLPKLIIDEEEKVSVRSGIVEHLRWKWSDTPICELIPLIGGEVTIYGEEEGERMSWKVQGSGCMECVEQIHNVQVEVFLEPDNIRLSAM